MPLPRLAAVVTLLLCASVTWAEETVTHVYRIGNSLTWDSQPAAIGKLASLRGHNHVQAWHINCGKPLQRIWDFPDEVCVKPVEKFGTFHPALTKHAWDAVTFQPHPGSGATLSSDAARILDFIQLAQRNPANAKTRFYIYAAWPGQRAGVYREVWTQETADADETRCLQTRAYFAHLLQRVRSKTKADVRIIPVGEVLYRLDEKLRDGAVPGIQTAADLYRDPVHLTQAGRYVAGATVFSVIHGENPAGMTKPEGTYGGPDEVSPALYKAAHAAIWEVVEPLVK